MKDGFKRIGSVLFLSAMICLLFSACFKLELPEEGQIASNLTEYYKTQEYSVRDSAAAVALQLKSLLEFDSVEIVEQQLDQENKRAYIKCVAVAKDTHGVFSVTDTWDLLYIYNDGWQCAEKNCLDTKYSLLADLSEEKASDLVKWQIHEDAVIDSVITAKTALTAKATYSYQTTSANFETFGDITANICGDAHFKWAPDGGWTIDSYKPNDSTKYICNVSCHIKESNTGLFVLNSEQFVLDFDLNISNNVVSIKNVKYQGSTSTSGNLTISNAQFQAGQDGKTAIVTFDYTRDVKNIEKDVNYRDIDSYKQLYRSTSGTGTLKIINNNGDCCSSLTLSGFILTGEKTSRDYNGTYNVIS